MRVLVVTNMYPDRERPAYGCFVRSQVESLQSVGVTAEVLFVDGRRSTAEYLRGLPRVREAARGPYDLLHAHYGLSGFLAVRQRRLPVVITYHGSDLLGTPTPSGGTTPKSRLARRLGLWAAARARALLVPSREMLQVLPEAARRRTRILPMGLDLERFRPMDREACCRQLRLDPARRRLLFVGDRDRAVKRFPMAASAAELLRREHPDVDLHVMNGVSPAEVPVHMNACDALLVTSVHEGSPMVVKEALACDLPVVSVDVGDVAERIRGLAGCRLAPPEAAGIACAAAAVLREDGPVRTRHAVEDLSLPRIAAALREVYRRALVGGP